MTDDIRHQLDQLLLEQGEYIPLELLLHEGRLSYEDYEAWRNNEISCLDEVLFGDPAQIDKILQQAISYMIALGWQAEEITYKSWLAESADTLRFSHNSRVNRYFHQRYRKSPDQPQLDLFTDSPATSLVNGITQALIGRNPDEARRLLERLIDTAPDHSRLGELECLVVADESLSTDVDESAKEIKYLRTSLTPIAENLLGKDSRNLLIPLWRRVSRAIQNQDYQASQEYLHLSYTASQSMDWQIVHDAVEKETYWQTDAILLQRHAQACSFLHLQVLSLLSWFMLCWQFPEQADALKNCSNSDLRQYWKTFLELEPELPAETFPAWLLIRKPALCKVLADTDSVSHTEHTTCPKSYRTLYQLQFLRLQSQGISTNIDDISLRTALKQQDPVLFQYFLASVDMRR